MLGGMKEVFASCAFVRISLALEIEEVENVWMINIKPGRFESMLEQPGSSNLRFGAQFGWIDSSKYGSGLY